MTAAQHLRQELADFLKQRRSRLLPHKVGLPVGRRRRVTGLRREEVAELAEISATWYVWIEQARPVKLSSRTLEGLTRALRLDSSEREYLYHLAGHSPPAAMTAESELPLAARESLRQFDPYPAYIHCVRWNLLHWNSAAEVVLGPWSTRPLEERNLLWLAFMDPNMRSLLTEWEKFARCTMNHFRANAGQGVPGRQVQDQLVGRLTAGSPEFRAWWQEHEVTKPACWRKGFNHPTLGPLSLDSCTLTVEGFPDVRLVLYTPADAATHQALRKICAF